MTRGVGRNTRPVVGRERVVRCLASGFTLVAVADTIEGMAQLDVDEMVARFRERARAVKQRPLPPVAGEERRQFIEQAQTDFADFAMIGDAQPSVEDGVLVLRIDLRPQREGGGSN